MSKIRLHGSSSGYTEIAPVAASGNNTLTLPNDGTIISQDSNGAVGVTSITVGTGVTIGDGRITCTTLHGSAANCTQIPAANIVGVCTSGLTKTGGFGKILGQYYGTSTAEHTSSSGSFQNAHSITFTPASNTSKFLIVYQPVRLVLGGSTDGEIRFTDGASSYSQQYRIAYTGSGYKQPCMHFWHNHTGYSGSTTLTCQTRDISGSNDTFMVGDNGSPSVIIVLEIAQ